MGLLETALRSILDLAAPPFCLGCGEPEARDLGLCPPCRLALRPAPSHRCLLCGRPLPSLGRCGRCTRGDPPWERLHFLWVYGAPLDRVVHAFKSRGLLHLGIELAECTIQHLATELRDLDAATPVPLHWSRRLRRGFNQAEVIARPLAAHLGIPLRPILRRPIGRPQRGRSRRARAAIRGHIESRSPIAGHVLLVDDVVTTGATLAAAANALRDAGAERVSALVLARAPAPAEGP